MKKYILLFIGVVTSFTFMSTPSVAATSGFNAGRIIDDAVFTNRSTMSVSDIQAFLNSKVPTCDTYGQQLSEFGGPDLNGDGKVQRWEWGKQNYNQTTFPCLRDYTQDGVTAAQLIYNASQNYSINPQVMITLLQKEQGLVTDTWPLNVQYRSATGYGCPDTAPCDADYYGLKNQLNWAATMFRAIMNNSPTWYTPYVLGDNYIQYSPDSSCGGSTVNIQNRSTQALYNYTPYQPNQAALDAGWGMAYCGAYGNRNFYLYFTSWFGSTHGGDLVSNDVRLTSAITTNPVKPVAGQDITVSYTVKNFRTTTVTYQSSILQCRYNTSTNCDSAYGSSTSLAPDESRTFTHTIKASYGGSYRIVPFFMENNLWYRYGVEVATQNSITLNIPDMRLTSSISVSPSKLAAGQQASISYKVKNYGSQSAVYENSVLQCRYELSTNCDSSYTGSLTIKPGEERSFKHTITAQSGGDYRLTPYFKLNGTWYTYTATSNTLQIAVPDLRLTGDIITTPAQPIPGQSMTVSYTMQNFGAKAVTYSDSVLQCRYNTTTNCDVDYAAGAIINPGESRTFTSTIPPVKAGTYNLVPYFKYDGKWYEYTKGVASDNKKSVVVPRYVADMHLITPITFTPSQPIPGEPVQVSYTVKNLGTLPAIYENSILQCRYNTSSVCDSAYTGSITIDPGMERVFNYTIIASAQSGSYVATPYFRQNSTWYKYKGSYSDSEKLTVATYNHDLRLVGDIATTPSQPVAGQPMTVSYTVHNHGSKAISYSSTVLQCRHNQNTNCDPTYGPAAVINAGESKSFTDTISSVNAGTYTLTPYYRYDNKWHKYATGTAEANTKTFNVE